MLRAKALVVPITASVHGVSTHAEDDLVLATAKSGGAGYVVTGDKGLLAVRRYKRILIVSPRAFLAIVNGR